jgi:hypothetical protein
MVFHGLQGKESKRELARICGCAPGTIENVRLRLEAKASRLDPVIRAHARKIRATEKNDERAESGNKTRRPGN